MKQSSIFGTLKRLLSCGGRDKSDVNRDVNQDTIPPASTQAPPDVPEQQEKHGKCETAPVAGPGESSLDHSPCGEPSQGKVCFGCNAQASEEPIKHKKPWWLLNELDLRGEFDDCRVKTQRICPAFLWLHRRDSLDEEAILAARGLKPIKIHGAHSSKPAQPDDEKDGNQCPLCPRLIWGKCRAALLERPN